MMADETPPTPMKPQDTVIYLLGELKGQVSSLKDSVDSSAASQALVNKANDEEHAKFRSDINVIDKAVAVLIDGNTTRRLTKYEMTQRWMVWLAVPAAFGSLISQFFIK